MSEPTRKNASKKHPNSEHENAPGAAIRVPDEEMSLSQKRHQTLPRPTPLREGDGLLPLKSRGLLASGGFLALLGLNNWRSFVGLGLAGVGGGLIYSGLKNNGVFEDDFKRRLLNTQLGEPRQLSASIIVERPVDEVFEAWSEPGNLGLCMEYIDRVERIDASRSRWRASGPNSNLFVEWESVIVESIDNESLAWRTVAGSEVNHEGVVEFNALPNGLRTEIRCKIVFFPPAGQLGQTLAKMLGTLSSKALTKELRRFKHFMEPKPTPSLQQDAQGRVPDNLTTPPTEHKTRPDLR